MAQLSSREMIQRMKIKFDGATVRLEINIETKAAADEVALFLHQELTKGDLLTLIRAEMAEPGFIHLLVIINTNEPSKELAHRTGRILMTQYKSVALIAHFQLEETDAIVLWNHTIDTAEMTWSINAAGGSG